MQTLLKSCAKGVSRVCRGCVEGGNRVEVSLKLRLNPGSEQEKGRS